MLIHAATNKLLNETNKVLWIVLIVTTHIIGALIYFFVGRRPQSVQPTPQVYVVQQQAYQPYQQPMNSVPPQQQSYREYQQGYGSVPATPQAKSYRQEQSAPYPEEHVYDQSAPFERPQAGYPEQRQ